jgi:zinc/manganese transport system permease protein
VSAIFEPGFFSNGNVHTAALVGSLVAVVTAWVGVFTVIRSQAFAGEALGDLGATGGSGAFLVGVNPLWGFIAVALAGATGIELLGSRDRSDRDLATGIVLGAGLGLAALFLYLDTTSSSTTGVSITVLFGSLFAIDPSLTGTIGALGFVAVGMVVVCHRRLLLSSLSPEVAAARGVPVRAVGAVYLAALAIAVALAALTIGAVLSTALLIGPPATALRISKRPGVAIALAAAIGVLATLLGILLAWDSYYWPPVQHGWPVSFMIVALVLAFYLLTYVPLRPRQRRGPCSQA